MDMTYGISGGGGYISRHGGGGGGGAGCFGRYVGGGGGGSCGLYDISMVDRIMSKFRPIAPKPVASSGSGSGDSTVENGGGNRRAKRKYVRVVNNNDKGCKRNKDSKKRKVAKSPERVSGGGDTVVTLSLMPETPDRKEKWSDICCSSEKLWLGFEKDWHEKSREAHVTKKQREQTVSFLVVEMVKEVKVDCGLVWWTEMERDTCPRFVTDSGDRVVWMNNTCRDMMHGGDEVVVMVVRNVGELPLAFTCNVRVTCQNGTRFSSFTVPCDAWRMGGGGGGGGGEYGWRLDIKAALSLGR